MGNFGFLAPLEGNISLGRADSQALKSLLSHKEQCPFSFMFVIYTFPRFHFYRMLILKGFNIEDILLHHKENPQVQMTSFFFTVLCAPAHTQSDDCNLSHTVKPRLAKDHLKRNVAVHIIFPFIRDLRYLL